MTKLEDLEKKLNITFGNLEIIRLAFVHRSYLNESRKYTLSNERLEFLGDSILSFLTSSYLYHKFPAYPEGNLTNLRSALVKTSQLAEIAKRLNLGSLILFSKGEEAYGGRENESILADTFEALLGAVYLDKGLGAVKKILDQFLFPRLIAILQEKAYRDPKSYLQEIVQEEEKVSPVYKVLDEAGPDHAKKFTIGVYVKDKLFGTGIGKSKQEAEMNAAKKALEKRGKKY